MSEWITAEEYRTAAKVASQYVNSFNAVALAAYDRVGFRHLREIGTIAIDDPRLDCFARGARVATWLLDNGWTPPEGLF